MTARTICMAAVFTTSSVIALAQPVGCPTDDMPKDAVSLLQTKLEVHKDMKHLESLEVSPSSLLAEKVEVEDTAASGSETLFVVLSDSSHYQKNLRWISDSWGKDVSPSQLLAIGDGANTGDNSTRIRIQTTGCPAHTKDGACCKAGEALIAAHRELEKQPNLKWAYIVEDDSYVRAEAMDKQLKLVDPGGKASRGILIAEGFRIGVKSCRNGVGGRGGIALNREALKSLVGDSPSKYLSSHMQTCGDCWSMARGDMAIGAQAHAHNIKMITRDNSKLPITFGMHTDIDSTRKYLFVSSLTSDVEPIMYHPVKGEGKMKFLHQLFAKQQKSKEDVHGVQFVEDVHGDYCATNNGNTVCTSDLWAMPWEPNRQEIKTCLARHSSLHVRACERFCAVRPDLCEATV